MGSQRPLALALDAVDVLGLASPCSSYWAFVVKGCKIFSFPLYDSSSIGGDDIPHTNFFSPLTELPQEPVLSPIISSTAHGPICAADHQKVPYFKLIWFAISYTRPSWVQTFVPVFHSVDRNPKISTKKAAAPATTSLPSQPPATTLPPFYSQASDRAGHSAYLHSVRLTTIGHKFRLKLSIYKGSPESEQLEI